MTLAGRWFDKLLLTNDLNLKVGRENVNSLARTSRGDIICQLRRGLRFLIFSQ
jgi:hypothetical protein